MTAGEQRLLKELQRISGLLERIDGRLAEAGLAGEAVSVVFFTTVNGQKRKVTDMNLKITQKLPLSVAFFDKAGNAAKVDGAPAWSLTNPDLGSLKVADDGLSAELTPSGKLGDCAVQVNADADLGEGVKNLLGELPVSFIGGEAVTVAIAAGDAVDL